MKTILMKIVFRQEKKEKGGYMNISNCSLIIILLVSYKLLLEISRIIIVQQSTRREYKYNKIKRSKRHNYFAGLKKKRL